VDWLGHPPFNHAAIEITKLISYRKLCSVVDYCDVEQTESNTAACCEAVAFIKENIWVGRLL